MHAVTWWVFRSATDDQPPQPISQCRQSRWPKELVETNRAQEVLRGGHAAPGLVLDDEAVRMTSPLARGNGGPRRRRRKARKLCIMNLLMTAFYGEPR